MDTQTNKKNQLKYNSKDSHQTTRGENKRRRKKSNKTKSKAINKMAIRTCISIIPLNGNGLNAATKRHRLNRYKSKTHTYAVYKRPTSILGTHTN